MTRAVEKFVKIGALVLASVGLLITCGGMVWALSSGLAEKADRSTVEKVQRRVNRLHTDIEVIKVEQRMLIRAIRPDLPVGKD